MKKILTLLLLAMTLPLMAQQLVLSQSDLLPSEIAGKPAELPAGLSEIPDAGVQTPSAVTAAPPADAQWGEWTEYDTGTFCYGSYYSMFFDSYTKHITLDRRDDLGGSGYSQIRFNKLFGDVDLIVNLDNNAGTISWEEMVLPYTDEESTYEGNFLHLRPMSNIKWYIKLPVYLNIWFMADSYRGYNLSSMQYQSDRVITGLDILRWKGLAPVIRCYNNTDTECIATYTPDPRIKRAQYLWYKMSQTEFPDLSVIKEYNPDADALKDGDNTFSFFDGAGLYRLYITCFDEENDLVAEIPAGAVSNFFNPDDWEDVGTGKFEPLLFTEYRRGMYEDIMTYTPDITKFDPYDVKVIRRKDTPEIIRVVNPFGAGTPYENIDTIIGEIDYSDIYEDGGISEMYISVFHDQDYFIEIDTREIKDGYNDGFPINRYLYRGLYWDNFGGHTFGYNAIIKDGIIKDEFNSEFILTLPDAKPGSPSVKTSLEKSDNTTFFEPEYAVASRLAVDIDFPADIYKYHVAVLCTQDYDPETTPKDIIEGKIPDVQSGWGHSGTHKFNYPNPMQSGTASTLSENNSYKIVAIATSSNGNIKYMSVTDHTRQADMTTTELIGTVSFIDPVLRAYGVEHTVTADIYEYPGRPGFFCIKAPWENSLYSGNLNIFEKPEEYTTPTDLIIDATDPERVKIEYGCVGYGNPSNDIFMWYAVDYATYQKYYGSTSSDDNENYGQYLKDDSDEVIWFPKMVAAYTSSSGQQNFSYGYGFYPTVFTITRNQSSTPEIPVDKTDSAPVYYNLQGQQVSNPARGM